MNLITCYRGLPTCRHSVYWPILMWRGGASACCMRAMGFLRIFWMKLWGKYLLAGCVLLLSLLWLREWKGNQTRDSALCATPGVPLGDWEREGEVGVVFRKRRSVKQWLMEEQKSSFKPFWIFHKGDPTTSGYLDGLRERVGTKVCILLAPGAGGGNGRAAQLRRGIFPVWPCHRASNRGKICRKALGINHSERQRAELLAG